MESTLNGRRPALSVLQASAMLVGIVIGIGIFKTPPLVAANAGSAAEFLALWAAGGILMIIGALCYAELASAHPSSGGEFHYLTRAYGRLPGFLFAWARMAVMQTGALAAVAFALGDYANVLVPLGENGPALHAAMSIIVFSGLQLFGTTLSGKSQATLTVLTIATLLLVTGAAFLAEPLPAAPAVASSPTSGGGAAGLALVFILLAYGGWNEAAYLSGEVGDARRNMAKVLLMGTIGVLVLYLAYNAALLYAFGLEGLRQTKTVVEGPVAGVFGSAGVTIVALIVSATAISTINATIFTGARSMYALGRSFTPLRALGRLNERNGAPTTAIIAQAAIALALVLLGAGTRDGFEAMVEYSAPVFWFFLFLVGLSLILFRSRGDGAPGAFRVPLYPLPPLIFCAMCLYLVYSSVVYTGAGALIGIAILAAGVPVYLLGRERVADRRDGEPARLASPAE